MTNQYSSINIHDLLDSKSKAYIGEDEIKKILSSFSCKVNPDVEHFLCHNAIEFTKKSQSVTYLVLNNETCSLAGYYSIAIKPITVSAHKLSRTSRKKIERISVLDEESQSYTLSAYLIAQIGKNYALCKEQQIPGKELLAYAYEQILEGKHSFGGVLAFLECDNKEFLIKFYKDTGHTLFNERKTKCDKDGNTHLLYQFMKFL
jgi:hypothetical protein